jgi:hypothetical protein
MADNKTELGSSPNRLQTNPIFPARRRASINEIRKGKRSSVKLNRLRRQSAVERPPDLDDGDEEAEEEHEENQLQVQEDKPPQSLSTKIKVFILTWATGLKSTDIVEDEADIEWLDVFMVLLYNRGFMFLVMWLVWLLVGTVYYSIALELNASKGFYMAVNVGYSVGWGDITETLSQSQVFSTCYVTVGASFVGAALGFFAEAVVTDTQDWYFKAQKSVAYEDHTKDHSVLWRIMHYVAFRWKRIRSLVMWLLFVIIGSICACQLNNWPAEKGVYFAVSSLSTGGLVSLPADSPEGYYLWLGIYGALGIPLMGLAMTTLASLIIDTGSMDDTVEAITDAVTDDEIEMMVKLGLEDGDGNMDKAEFMIMCLLRTGVDPELLMFLNTYFQQLDKDGDGSLSLKELANSDSFKPSKQKLKERFRKRAGKVVKPEDRVGILKPFVQEEEEEEGEGASAEQALSQAAVDVTFSRRPSAPTVSGPENNL